MKSVKERIAGFWKKERSKPVLEKLSDIFFILLIIAVLIPPVRRQLSATVIRLTMTQPASKAETGKTLSANDYLWQISNLQGESYNLGDFRGKVIFLNFWATWCPPCRAEMPGIQELYNDYKDKVSFILVSNETPGKIIPFLNSKSFNLPVYTPLYQTPQIFESNSIPTTFIISKDGKIVLKDTGAKKWDGRNVRKLLDKLIAQ